MPRTKTTEESLPDFNGDDSPTKGGLRHAWRVALKKPWSTGVNLVTIALGVLALVHWDTPIYLGAMQVSLGASQFIAYWEQKKEGGANQLVWLNLAAGVLGFTVGGFLIVRSLGLV